MQNDGNWLALRRRLERGDAALVFGLGMILILIAFAGFLWDVRHIARSQVIAQNLIDLAAHKAGSDVDIARFKHYQEIAFAPDAEALAVATIRSGRPTYSSATPDFSLTVSGTSLLYAGTFMEIRGEITVPLNFLSRAFGIGTAKRTFLTIIQPSYGIQREGD